MIFWYCTSADLNNNLQCSNGIGFVPISLTINEGTNKSTHKLTSSAAATATACQMI
jgi:hypothetical protein